ncbi:MAG: BA14K-like protein [Devosia sp.]|nr:BA14K-like protein [Devosia sp.]
MKTIINTVGAVAMAGLLAVSGSAPAQAQSFSFERQDRVIRSYCDSHRRDPDCRRHSRGDWGRRDYDRFYSRHRSGLDSVASGLFGFTFGAIVGGAIANQNNNSGGRVIGRVNDSHVEACAARYRSYDVRTDTFLSYDGNRYRCNL